MNSGVYLCVEFLLYHVFLLMLLLYPTHNRSAFPLVIVVGVQRKALVLLFTWPVTPLAVQMTTMYLYVSHLSSRSARLDFVDVMPTTALTFRAIPHKKITLLQHATRFVRSASAVTRRSRAT